MKPQDSTLAQRGVARLTQDDSNRSLRATEKKRGNLIIINVLEIASVVSLPRKDIFVKPSYAFVIPTEIKKWGNSRIYFAS